ncbi:MAG: MerR family transcriptional regulator [Streptococcaceae bacterium]|jgi:DNA-binding transcriptional MerR regulator|nr:MerR family transcriptional regulator [Streptococcaceae bacterium]
MEYSINKLAQISGVTKRTLHYYDEIGLLKAVRKSNGYRIYGRKEVDLLQQILLFKEMDVPLNQIKEIIQDPNFDRKTALTGHLDELTQKAARLNRIIEMTQKTIDELHGGKEMKDKEKFEAFKDKMIQDNEEEYGKEVREKYGDKQMEAAMKQVKGMTAEKYQESEHLRELMAQKLKKAVEEKMSPDSEFVQEIADLHKQWLMIFYPKYSKPYHRGLGEMYLADERFKAHYEEIIVGATELLNAAIQIYAK